MTMSKCSINTNVCEQQCYPNGVDSLQNSKLKQRLKESNFVSVELPDLKQHEILIGKIKEEPFQRNNARGNVVAGNVGGQNRVGNMNPGQAKPIIQDAADEMLIEKGVVLDEDQFVVSCRRTSQFDAFDSLMLMRDPPTTEPCCIDAKRCTTQLRCLTSDADYTSDSNIIPYDQYVEDNEEHVVQSNVSSVRNDALISILDEMHEQGIKNLEHQIQEKDNVIRHLKDRVANVNDRSRVPYNAIDVTALVEQNDCYRVELEKVKQHYKEFLKAQLRSKEPCFTSDYVKPKVLAPGMYAIDVKPIPHPLKNNRGAHLNYVKHLKESVETVREITQTHPFESPSAGKTNNNHKEKSSFKLVDEDESSTALEPHMDDYEYNL
ncbi:hypothetical protein Tco_0648276 [Tanacetum coccineum]